jgi:hypothetical protein
MKSEAQAGNSHSCGTRLRQIQPVAEMGVGFTGTMAQQNIYAADLHGREMSGHWGILKTRADVCCRLVDVLVESASNAPCLHLLAMI